MDAHSTAMITAVVGVLGTLFAPLLSERLGAHRRQEEAAVAEQRLRFEERRDAYTAMNRSSRQFHTLLKDALHRLRDGVWTDTGREELEQARRDYRDHYAAAQMMVPERVLAASRDVNKVLAAVDAMVKRMDRGLAREGESPGHALTSLKAAEPFLSVMRELMRADLGLRD